MEIQPWADQTGKSSPELSRTGKSSPELTRTVLRTQGDKALMSPEVSPLCWVATAGDNWNLFDFTTTKPQSGKWTCVRPSWDTLCHLENWAGKPKTSLQVLLRLEWNLSRDLELVQKLEMKLQKRCRVTLLEPFYKVTTDKMRGNALKLCQRRFRLDGGEKVFMERVVRLWHRLPMVAVVVSPSLEVSTNHVDVALGDRV
ncbi:hypothetical protein WISP_101030 [Willisornis vidua]|uniref:Uncharacterized protein n=1 Tax=Willisornis vidua TaxID=1566151 RepID=A0ABQ9D411_9PASS|nr:hypothetical protein WISP_101030 [Willisornis vidua]